MLANIVMVAIGSALGGVARYLLTLAMPYDSVGGVIPTATLLANLSGSAVIGVLAGLAMPGGLLAAAPGTILFLATGVLGGFTTFSAFSQETAAMFSDGEPWLAMFYVTLTSWGCVAAAMLGLMVGSRI